MPFSPPPHRRFTAQKRASGTREKEALRGLSGIRKYSGRAVRISTDKSAYRKRFARMITDQPVFIAPHDEPTGGVYQKLR